MRRRPPRGGDSPAAPPPASSTWPQWPPQSDPSLPLLFSPLLSFFINSTGRARSLQSASILFCNSLTYLSYIAFPLALSLLLSTSHRSHWLTKLNEAEEQRFFARGSRREVYPCDCWPYRVLARSGAWQSERREEGPTCPCNFADSQSPPPSARLLALSPYIHDASHGASTHTSALEPLPTAPMRMRPETKRTKETDERPATPAKIQNSHFPSFSLLLFSTHIHSFSFFAESTSSWRSRRSLTAPTQWAAAHMPRRRERRRTASQTAMWSLSSCEAYVLSPSLFLIQLLDFGLDCSLGSHAPPPPSLPDSPF